MSPEAARRGPLAPAGRAVRRTPGAGRGMIGGGRNRYD